MVQSGTVGISKSLTFYCTRRSEPDALQERIAFSEPEALQERAAFSGSREYFFVMVTW